MEFPRVGEGEETRFILRKDASISGTVRDASRQPVEGVRILVSATTGGAQSFNANVNTGVHGTYYIERVPHGRVVIQAGVASAVSVGKSGHTAPPPQTLELAPGEYRRNVDIELGEGLELIGTLRNEDGKPIAGAEVNPNIVRTGQTLEMGATVPTDADGNFTIGGLGESSRIDNLSIMHPDYDRIDLHNITAASGPLEIVMKQSSTRTSRSTTATWASRSSSQQNKPRWMAT